ncbi:Uridine phosphorylase [Bienertia sinuspersici]
MEAAATSTCSGYGGIFFQRHNLTMKNFRVKSPTLFSVRSAIGSGDKESVDSSNHGHDGSQVDSKPLGMKWAHPISLPETGSVLVATEKLDGVRTF